MGLGSYTFVTKLTAHGSKHNSTQHTDTGCARIMDQPTLGDQDGVFKHFDQDEPGDEPTNVGPDCDTTGNVRPHRRELRQPSDDLRVEGGIVVADGEHWGLGLGAWGLGLDSGLWAVAFGLLGSPLCQVRSLSP